MKKTLMITLLSATALTLFATSADAVKKDDKTDVGVSFKTTDDNTIGDHKPFKDNLAIVWKPTAFEFGSQKALEGTATYNKVATGAQYVIVNDDRPDGQRAKWEVKAQLTALTDTQDSTNTLTSKLAFNLGDDSGKLLKYNIGDTIGPDNDYVPNNPKDSGALEAFTGQDFVIGNAGKTAVTLEGGIDSPQPIIAKTTAGPKEGVAVQIRDVKLAVIGASAQKVQSKSFASQVIWTLDDLK